MRKPVLLLLLPFLALTGVNAWLSLRTTELVRVVQQERAALEERRRLAEAARDRSCIHLAGILVRLEKAIKHLDAAAARRKETP